jgi:HK97 family phage major capsid protein
VNENEAIPESNMSFDSVGLSPKHVGGLTELSRQLIQQSSPDVEQLVRDDLAAVLAGAIDGGMIAGGADPRERTGILRTSGTLAATLGDLNGASPAPWRKVLAMLGALEDVNVTGPLNWLLSPKAARALKIAPKVDDGSAYLLEGGRLADIPAITSARVPNADATNATAILGDFTQVMLGIWSELDLLVNPFAETAYRKGNVLVRAMATVDVAVRAPQAFVISDDLTVPAWP